MILKELKKSEQVNNWTTCDDSNSLSLKDGGIFLFKGLKSVSSNFLFFYNFWVLKVLLCPISDKKDFFEGENSFWEVVFSSSIILSNLLFIEEAEWPTGHFFLLCGHQRVKGICYS